MPDDQDTGRSHSHVYGAGGAGPPWWRDSHARPGGVAAPDRGYDVSAHGGWDCVVGVSPRIAAIMGDKLPHGVEVGPET